MQEAEYYSWQDFDSHPTPHDYEGDIPTEVCSWMAGYEAAGPTRLEAAWHQGTRATQYVVLQTLDQLHLLHLCMAFVFQPVTLPPKHGLPASKQSSTLWARPVSVNKSVHSTFEQ